MSKRKKSDRMEELVQGEYYTLPNVFKWVGLGIIVLTIGGSAIIRSKYMPWVLANRFAYQHACVSIVLVGGAIFIMARQKLEDMFSRNLRNRTNRFTLLFTFFLGIIWYDTMNQDKIEVGFDAFVVVIMLSYVAFFYIIKIFGNEKLDKTGESEDRDNPETIS